MPGGAHLSLPTRRWQRPVPRNAGAVGRLALATAVAALLGSCSDTVEVDAPQPSADDRAACRSLLDAVPDRVADQESRPVEPDDSWGAAWGDPAIVLTCGGPPPEDFERTSTCTVVNDVDWFIPEDQLEDPSPDEVTMTTVHRTPVVTVVMPGEYWPPATTLADLSGAVTATTKQVGSCV